MKWEQDIDNTHLLISTASVTELSEFINTYKNLLIFIKVMVVDL